MIEPFNITDNENGVSVSINEEFMREVYFKAMKEQDGGEHTDEELYEMVDDFMEHGDEYLAEVLDDNQHVQQLLNIVEENFMIPDDDEEEDDDDLDPETLEFYDYIAEVIDGLDWYTLQDELSLFPTEKELSEMCNRLGQMIIENLEDYEEELLEFDIADENEFVEMLGGAVSRFLLEHVKFSQELPINHYQAECWGYLMQHAEEFEEDHLARYGEDERVTLENFVDYSYGMANYYNFELDNENDKEEKFDQIPRVIKQEIKASILFEFVFKDVLQYIEERTNVALTLSMIDEGTTDYSDDTPIIFENEEDKE